MDLSELTGQGELEETVLTDAENHGGWEYILSELQDHLPGIESDSEVSSLSEEGHGAIFIREVATFDNTDSDSDVSSLSNFQKSLSEKPDSSALNSEGYVSASSASPTSNTSSATPQPSTDDGETNPQNLSPTSSSHYTSLLFQRLQTHLKDNVHMISHESDDLHLYDMDLELPIYAVEKSALLVGLTEKNKYKDRSPPPLDMQSAPTPHPSVPVSEMSSAEIYNEFSSETLVENGKAPVLSLRGLEGFDLDDLLDDLYVDDSVAMDVQFAPSDSSKGNSEPPGILDQLAGLGKTQISSVQDVEQVNNTRDPKTHFLASGQLSDKPRGTKNIVTMEKAEIEEINEKSSAGSSSISITTASCGVSTCFTSETQLSISEPTTIFLDLRPKYESPSHEDKVSEEEDKKKKDPIEVQNIAKPTKSAAVSTGTTTQQTSERVRRLTRIRTMTREEPEESDSESDDEDYREWQAIRRRIKDRSTLTAAASPKSLNARKRESEPASRHDEGPKLKLDLSQENVKKSPEKPKADSSSDDKVKKSFGKHMNNIEHIDKNLEEDRKDSLSEVAEHTSDAKVNGTINAMQRLKSKVISPVKSSLKNESQPADESKKGKITVTFAEEPKKDDSDTTNVYRAKASNTKSPIFDPIELQKTTYTTSCIQTEDSFPHKSSNIKLHDVVDVMLKRREDEKSLENEIADKLADRALLSKKLEQARAAVSATPYSDGKLERETRMKLKMLLEREQPKLENGAQLLYDMDASYDFEIPNVPPTLNTDKAEMVLLTINMSSTGTIVTHRNSGGHKATPVDPGIGFSITYPMLLSWLCALMPEDLKKLHQARMDDSFAIDIDPELIPELTNGKDGPIIPISVDVPFNVVALHQSWQEDSQSLALQAIVIPNFFYKPESKRGRKKTKKEDAFLDVVWHFLQSNRIQDVCPWHDKPESPIHYSLAEIIITCATKPLSTFVAATNDPLAIKKTLKNSPGIFSKMVTPDDQVASPPSDSEHGKLQMTMCLLQKEAFMFPTAVLDLAIRLQTHCFDLSGLRLCYVTRKFINSNTLYHNTDARMDPDEVVPCVVMAIRGRSVISIWSKIVGPRDPVLARMSEIRSLNATYGEQLSIKRGDESLPTDVNMFCYPRSEARAMQQICVWFGGRVNPESKPFKNLLEPKSVPNIGTPSKQEKPTTNGKNSGKNWKNKSRSNSTISINEDKDSKEPATVKDLLHVPSYIITCCDTQLFLIVSPRLPTQFISDVLYTITHQGFQLRGVKRFRLNERKAAALSISPRYYPCFCPRLDADVPAELEYYEDIWWTRPATIILLSRENAVAHQAGLLHALQSDLMVNLSPPEEEGHMKGITYQCFHTTPYTESTENAIGSLTKVPEVELSTGSSPRSFYSNPEMEQVVVLSLLGEGAIDDSGEILRNLLHGDFPLAEERNVDRYTSQLLDDESELDHFRGFELLGMKWLPSLNGMQANELTPFEVGTSAWHESIPVLQSSPVMLFILRRVDAFQVLQDVMRIPQWCTILDPDRFTHIMSTTPEIAYRQMRMFFSDKELFPDNQSRPLLKYLPPPTRVHQYRQQNEKPSSAESEINSGGDQQNHSNGGSRQSENTKRSSTKKKKKQAKKDTNNNSNQNGNGSASTSLSLPDESIFASIVTCQQPLTSVLIIKPDAFPRHFIKIFRQLHYEGFNVVAMNAIKMSEHEAMQIMPPFLKDMHGECQVYTDHMTSGLSLVICVQRDNAVRHLCELAGPYDPRVARSKCYLQHRTASPSSTSRATWRALFGIDNISNGIHVSDSYLAACDEMKLFFPEGLCCRETLELKMELIPSPAEDTYMCIDRMMGREVNILLDERQSNYCTSLRVTYMPRKPVVIVLPPTLFQTNGANKNRLSRHSSMQKSLKRGAIPPYVEILDQLLTQGFEGCAMRMVWFRQTQAEQILKILNSSQSEESMVDIMTQGPSLLLILQRENALVLFDSILGSTKSNGDSLYHKYSKYILRSQKEEQTKRASRYLFPRVPFPNSVITISHKRAMEWKERNGDDTDIKENGEC